MSAAERGIVLLAMALGALSLGFRLGWQDLWWDEEVTLMFSRMSWRELIIDHWGLDTHRPVYYAMQKLWNGVAGESIAALRGLPVLVTLLIVPVFHRIGREIGGRPMAALAALLLVTAPMFVYQGRELRMYCLLNLCLALSLLFAVRLARAAREEREGTEDTGSGWLVVGFSFSLALAFHAQAIAVVVAVLYGVWAGLAIVLGLLPRRFLRVVLAGAGLFVLFSIPAIMPFLGHFTGTVGESFWLPDPTPRFVYDQTLGAFPYPKWTKPPVFLLFLWGAWCLWRRKPAEGLLLIILAAGLPILVYLISLSKPLYLTRVIAWSGFVSILLLAAGLACLPQVWRWIGAALITAAQIGHLATFYPGAPEVSPYAALSETLETFDPARDMLVLDDQRLEPALRWYHPGLFDGRAFAFLKGDNRHNVIDAAFRSVFVPRAEAAQIPLDAERLFILRSVGKGGAPVAPEDRVDDAVAAVIGGRLPQESAQSDRYRVEIYALP